MLKIEFQFNLQKSADAPFQSDKSGHPHTYEDLDNFFINLWVQALWSTLYLGLRQVEETPQRYTTMARSQRIDLAPFESLPIQWTRLILALPAMMGILEGKFSLCSQGGGAGRAGARGWRSRRRGASSQWFSKNRQLTKMRPNLHNTAPPKKYTPSNLSVHADIGIAPPGKSHLILCYFILSYFERVLAYELFSFLL